MLAGLADSALSYFESYVTPHLEPIPPALQFGDHPLNPCVSLFVDVPNQLTANGSKASHPLLLGVSAIGG